jgi:hypothetical protein
MFIAMNFLSQRVSTNVQLETIILLEFRNNIQHITVLL